MTLAEPLQRELWNAMPGWGIAADLTPPEVVETRRLRRNVRYTVVGLVAVVALILLGYGYALLNAHGAGNGLNQAEGRQQQLMQQSHKYQDVVEIQGGIAQVQGQLATLMGSDTDFGKLVQSLSKAAPASVAITDLKLDITGGATTSTATQSLDTSGQRAIGTLAITAEGAALRDASKYVVALKNVPGLIDVFPTKNSADGVATSFEITATLTDTLLSHRYVVQKSAPKTSLTSIGAK